MLSDTLPAIILAGERAGGSAFAQAQGIAAGVLADVGGQSCLARVVDALNGSRSICGGLVVGPAADIWAGETALRSSLGSSGFAWFAPAAGPSASAMSAARHLDQFPLLLTAGDHALLTPAIVDEFCRAALAVEADMIVGLVPYACVQAAYPHSIRTRLRFRDGHCCGSNLFLLKRTGALAVLDFWRDLEAARKQPWRMAARLGLVPLWRYLVSGLDVADAFALLSQRVGARLGFVPLRHARAAIDVDSSADLELAREIIAHDRA